MRPKANAINFLRQGELTKGKKVVRTSVLGEGDDWLVMSDLNTQLVVPTEIAITLLRPDIILVSKKTKSVVMCELTCPWEENAEWAHERKLLKYEDLKNEARDNGWNARVYAVEVGCRGFASRSLRDFFTAIGSSNKKIKSTIEECCAAAEKCSVDIYMKRKDRWSYKESETSMSCRV